MEKPDKQKPSKGKTAIGTHEKIGRIKLNTENIISWKVRPALEYGISAWSTTAKTNFNKICRVQNQASRIITGGMKSTPIQMLESTAQLQPMEERRDMKTAIHYEKIKRMTGHHLYPRAHALSRGRIKRESMI